METLQPLAIESFSCSWLIDPKPLFDGLDESFRASLDSLDEAISKERDHEKLNTNRLLSEAQNFNFDVPLSQSSAALVHADELFFNGLIKPVYAKPSKIKAFGTSTSTQSMPVSSISSSSPAFSVVGIHHHFPRKWQKLLKRFVPKYFGFLKLSCHKWGGSRKSTRVDNIDRRVREVKSWNSSPPASPRLRTAYSAGEWCDLESAIYEAVLHCKRSIEK